MNFFTASVQGNVPITLIRPQGRLDGQTYKDLIARASQLYAAGARNILLDLSEVSYLSSAGIVALHTIALMLQGERLPDVENGWSAVPGTGRSAEAGLQKHLKLLNPRPEVNSVLEMVGFTAFLEIFKDQDSAIMAF